MWYMICITTHKSDVFPRAHIAAQNSFAIAVGAKRVRQQSPLDEAHKLCEYLYPPGVNPGGYVYSEIMFSYLEPMRFLFSRIINGICTSVREP